MDNPLCGTISKKQNNKNNYMQHFVDQLNATWQAQRSQSQITLGKLIHELQSLPPDTKIQNISEPHSYRGYYCDLAFESKEGTTTAGEFLGLINEKCLDETFEGYKGGDYTMNENTPIWISDYGSCGVKIIDIQNGKFITEEDD